MTAQQDELHKEMLIGEGWRFVREEREDTGVGRRWWIIERIWDRECDMETERLI